MDIRIGVNESNQRFDRFLRKYCRASSFITLTQIYSRIRKWQVKINGRKARENTILTLDDTVMIHDSIIAEFHLWWQTATHRKSLQIDQIRTQIVDEDQDRIVWNKPAHLLVHPAHDMSEITLNDYLESYYAYQSKQHPDQSWSSQNHPTFKPSFGFRLDKDTSGIIIGAKHYQALQYLNQQIRLRQTIKRYIAIVAWSIRHDLHMEEPLFKGFSETRGKAEVFVNYDKWLPCHTSLTPLLTTQDPKLWPVTAVLLRLHTGRMHQIRVHCAHHGLPIVGDRIYGNLSINTLAHKHHGIVRQLLHCYRYGLLQKESDITHPIYHRWTAPLWSDMTSLFDNKLLQEKIDTKLWSLMTLDT